MREDGAWVLLHWLPGSPLKPADDDKAADERARGRLLAEFHEAAAATSITDQRAGFTGLEQVVSDPNLHHWLRVHESANPDEGRILRTYLDAAVAWFAGHPSPDARRSVIHGDFTPWNLLFDEGRLTGVLDFEASHYTFQVADFALSWRGYHDEVIRGYDEVRPLSVDEWELLRPVFWAWMFIGVKHMIATHYGGDSRDVAPLELEWQARHLQKESDLLSEKLGVRAPELLAEG